MLSYFHKYLKDQKYPHKKEKKQNYSHKQEEILRDENKYIGVRINAHR